MVGTRDRPDSAVLPSTRSRASGPRTHLTWLAAGLVLGFLVPFVFADVLGLPRDLYYGIYVAFVVALFVLWARSTGQLLVGMVRRRLLLTLVLATVFGLVMVLMVLRMDASTAAPDGLELAWLVSWRGVVYGAADGLLLSAFPILTVFAASEGSRLRARVWGKTIVGALALAASLAMTAAYHAGYQDFRSEKLAKPVAGDVAWSVPTLATLNPIGAPLAHAALHVTAVLNNQDTDLFLPPHE